MLQTLFSCYRKKLLYYICYCCLLSPCFTHGREPSLLPLSHASSQATTCNKKLTPKIRIITVYWNTPLKCLHLQHHTDPAKHLGGRGGEKRETRASSWEARGFMLAAAQQAAGTDLPLKLLTNNWLLPIIGFTNNNQVKISNLSIKLLLKERECCPVGVGEEGMLRKGRHEKVSWRWEMCFVLGQSCRIPYSTLSAPSLTSGTAKCHCGDSRDELGARAESMRPGDVCAWERERKRKRKMEI